MSQKKKEDKRQPPAVELVRRRFAFIVRGGDGSFVLLFGQKSLDVVRVRRRIIPHNDHDYSPPVPFRYHLISSIP